VADDGNRTFAADACNRIIESGPCPHEYLREPIATAESDVLSAEQGAQRIAGLLHDLLGCPVLPGTEERLTPASIGVKLPAQGCCGLHGSVEITRNDQIEVSVGKTSTECFRLFAPGRRERRVGMALPATGRIARGLPVADEGDLNRQRMLLGMRPRRLGVMLYWLIALSDSIVPEDTSARVIWAVVAVVILGLYYLMKRARKNATRAYWERRKAEEERIANDPDMRKD